MQETPNKILSPIDVVRRTYQNLMDNLKSYCLLVYVILFPTFASQYFWPVRIDPDTSKLDIILPLILTFSILVILSIFLFRLFMLGKENLFKLSASKLFDMMSRSFLYSIALAMVLVIALFSVGLLFMLILTIIGSIAGENTINSILVSTIGWIGISFFLMLIIFRTLPTFISIAIGSRTIPMKTAYYYTRENNKSLLIIGICCYLPLTIISAILGYIVGSIGIENDVIMMLISFMIIPISIAPLALQLSAGSELYKELIPMDDTVQTNNTGNMV